ncbi:MAG: hypothetical protein RLZZ511_3168 [Cyanobacteriota bacterium]
MPTPPVAVPQTAASQTIAPKTIAPQTVAQVVKACPYDGFPKFFSRIRTKQGDPLRVRATPNGKPIGAIPDKWAVVVLEWSRNGVWARVTSHWGEDDPRFGSASDFKGGWVAAAYLEDLGRFCEKPEAVAQVVAPQVFGAVPVEVQSDWLAMGDALVSRG